MLSHYKENGPIPHNFTFQVNNFIADQSTVQALKLTHTHTHTHLSVPTIFRYSEHLAALVVNSPQSVNPDEVAPRITALLQSLSTGPTVD